MGSIPTLSILHGDVKPLKGIPLLLHRFLEQTVCLNRQHKALTFQSSTLTFGTLDAAASRLARALLCHVSSVGAQANQDGDFLVAVCMEPSDQLVITLLAVWKIGAAYLPIDPKFPPARASHILREAQPLVMIAEKDHPEAFAPFRNTVLYDELCQQAANLSADPLPDSETLTGGNTTLALVLYTSGSTGIPKGVRLPHQVVFNRLYWQWRTFPYGPNENVCVFKTALTFVDSVAELWGPLLQGRSVFVVPHDVIKDPQCLLHVLEEQKVQRLVLVPSLLRSLLLVLGFEVHKGLLTHLKTWVCSGEPLPAQLAHDFFAHFNSGEHILCNFYGSTEVMGDVTYHVMRSASEVKDSVPIGRSLDNTAIYLLDGNYQPVVSGEVGELYVSGLNVALGYVRGRDPKCFLPNQLTVDPDHSRLYRTGDFARLVKGTLIYEGRTDSQVKVRGHRVDLSEVQRAVAAVPGIDKCVVLCYKPGQIEQALLAYVTTQSGACLESHHVETALHKSLASYMQPQVFVVDSIPLLVNGKTDRQELLRRYDERNAGNGGHKTDSPALDYTGIAANQLEAAHTLFETVVSVLGGSVRSKVCRDANFYDLGGNSLNSVFTVTKLREQGYVIGITSFTSSKDLQEVIDQMHTTSDSDTAAGTETKEDREYVAHMLQDVHKDAVNHMITESFYWKADLEQWLKSDIHRADYKDLIDKLWEPLLLKNLSFLIKDTCGEPVGVALNFDAHDEPCIEISSKLAIVFDFLEFLEGPIREMQLPQGKGKVLHSFMMATGPALNYQQNVKVMNFMEAEVLRLAQTRGFAGIFTTNTNPLTQQLGDLYDYEVLHDYQVNLYVAPDGSKPFQKAPESQKAMCSWRPLCSHVPK